MNFEHGRQYYAPGMSISFEGDTALITSVISKSSNGVVYGCTFQGKTCVVKHLESGAREELEALRLVLESDCIHLIQPVIHHEIRGAHGYIILKRADCDLQEYVYANYNKIRKLIYVARQVASIIAEMHEHGFSIGDVSLENFVVTNGRVRLIDVATIGSSDDNAQWSFGKRFYKDPFVSRFKQRMPRLKLAQANDVFCLGIAIMLMFTSLNYLTEGDKPEFLQGYSTAIRFIESSRYVYAPLKQFLTIVATDTLGDPDTRVSAREVSNLLESVKIPIRSKR